MKELLVQKPVRQFHEENVVRLLVKDIFKQALHKWSVEIPKRIGNNSL